MRTLRNQKRLGSGSAFDADPKHWEKLSLKYDKLTDRMASTGGRHGRHRHLQIGQMLDIDLISEPPPPTPQMYVSKVWESVWPEGAGSDS